MTDRDMLELIAMQVARLTKDVDEIKANMATKQELAATNQSLAEIRKTMATKQELAEIRKTMATKQELAATNQSLAVTNQRLAATNQELAEVKAEVSSIKDIVVRIEIDHGQKLGALLNGYTQNAERLDRVEAKLAEHDRIIVEKLG